ncbi:MAG TPA: ABC transporter permease [Streptomyces sp.]|nr:ABC transporter permease [Streptomyces sp.]
MTVVDSARDRVEATPPATKRGPRLLPFAGRLLPLIPGVVLVLGWQYASDRLIRKAYVSSPTDVVQRLYDLFASGEVFPHLQTTFTELVFGYGIGALVGIMVGYSLGRSRLMARMLEPYILAFYGVPKIAFAPLFIIWFGVGVSSKIALAGAMVFFMVFFNVYFGVRSVDRELLDVADVMGVKGRKLTRYVYLPASLPHIVLGLRSALPYSVIGVVVGEFSSASSGLGLYMYQSSVNFDPAGVFAGVIILLLYVLLGSLLLSAVQKRALRWQPQSHDRSPSA